MVLQLSVFALSWIYTKYIHRDTLKNHEKGEETNRMNEQENLSASLNISIVLSNSSTTDKLTSQVLATIAYFGKERKKKKI